MIVACVSLFSGLMHADTDVVIDLSGITQENASTDVNNGITVTSTRKSQSVTYYTGGQLRFYKGDGLTVNSISDNIVKVTFTSAETSKNTLDGLISDQNGVIASAGNTAQHAEFSVSSPVDQFSFINTAQVRINTMTVTIADGGTVTETVAAPVISPADGSELSEGNNTVTIGCDTEGATVYYTIDGSVPTVESDMYSGPFQLTSSATVKAVAVKDGMNNSPVSSVTYVYRVQGVFSLVTSEDELVAGDMYIIAAAKFDMAMSNAVKKNNRPAVAAVKSGNNIENPSDQVAWIQLVRQDAGWALKVTNGDLSGQYLYNPLNDKNYLEGATEIKAVATIGVSDAGVATVKFTTNTSKNWIRYNSSSDLFSCYGSGQSDIALYRKVSVASAVATPVIVADDENNVTISCETESALLYYTIDGSAPTDRSIPYQPFSVDRTTTVKAIAYLGDESSAVATLEVKVPEMMSLAEFLDQKPADKVRVNGPLTVIYQNGDYMYVTDGQGSNVLCFGAVDDVYVNGNTLQYLYGRYDEFKGLPELAGPVCGPRGEDAGEVEPQAVTSLADMSRYALNSYLTLGAVGISEVKENNAVFTDPDGNTYNAYLNSNYGVAYPDDQTVRYYVTGFTSVYSNGRDVSLQFTPVSFVDEGTAIGIVEISSDNEAERETVWFTIGGVRVESPTVSGVYVRVQGSRAEKVIL